MPKFPEPPRATRLRAVGHDTVTLPAGTELARVYFQASVFAPSWNQFRRHGPTDARFDHHELPRRTQARGILYAAPAIQTCLAEVFQVRRAIVTSVQAPWLVSFALARDVVLLDLTGTWPTRAGASMAIHSGLRARARRWSAPIYDAYPSIDGLYYCSSMDANRPAVALYKQAERAVPPLPVLHRPLTDPALRPVLEASRRALGYALY